MYKCQHCSFIIGPRIPATMIVVAKRVKEYHNYHPDGGGMVITKGWETERELRVCPSCVKEYEELVASGMIH